MHTARLKFLGINPFIFCRFRYKNSDTGASCLEALQDDRMQESVFFTDKKGIRELLESIYVG